METKQPESEIVIKITPRNLERLIYFVIILTLLIFSIVMFAKKSPNCPDIECNASDSVSVSQTEDSVEEDNSDTTTETTDETVEEIETTPTVSESTGKVDFLLTDVKLCTLNETEDKGRFDTITVYIKNGMDRLLNAKVDLYLWDSNDDDTLQDYPAQKIEKIKVLAGATFTHTYEMTGGMFTDLDVGKTVKAVLIDSDLSKKLGEQSKTSVKPSADC
jgi:hypothetical protein